MKPLVSIVIPVKNGIKYLPETIESVLKQDYNPIEIVISDDNSMDGSYEYVINQARNIVNLRVIRPPKEKSIDEHWTFACQNSLGEFIKLLCSDDLIAPTAITNQVGIMQSFPTVGFVATRRNIIGPSGRVILRGRGLDGISGLHNGKYALKKSVSSGTNIFGEPGSVLFRRSALLDSLPWDATLPYMLDAELYFRLLRKWDVFCSHKIDGSFRIHNSSLTSRVHNQHTSQFMEVVKREIEFGSVSLSFIQKFALYFRIRFTTIMRSLTIILISLFDRLDIGRKPIQENPPTSRGGY